MTTPTRPALSVITVCFNAASTLPSCIDSVAAEKSGAVEYIVIDGASSDDTRAVLARYAAVIDVLVSEPDGGIFDAMNKGIARARGDYIAFLNADDVFLPGALTEILATLARPGRPVDVLYGDWVGVDSRGGEHRRTADHRLRWKYSLCHQAMVARRSLFQGPTPFDLRYSLCADFDLILRWQQAGARFEHMARPLVRFSEVGASARFMRESARQSIDIAMRRADAPWSIAFSLRIALYVLRVGIASSIRRARTRTGESH